MDLHTHEEYLATILTAYSCFYPCIYFLHAIATYVDLFFLNLKRKGLNKHYPQTQLIEDVRQL